MLIVVSAGQVITRRWWALKWITIFHKNALPELDKSSTPLIPRSFKNCIDLFLLCTPSIAVISTVQVCLINCVCISHAITRATWPACLFFSSVQQPKSGLGCLVEVSRWCPVTHRTPGRTSLNEWSARLRGRYLRNIQQTRQTSIHALRPQQ